MARAFGLDISKYQAPQDKSIAHGIDFAKMISMVDFLVVRAGYAGSATLQGHEDERVREYMADLVPLLKQTPIPFTFYWFFRDDASISSQATVFARLVNEFKEVVNLSLVCDAEIFERSISLSTSKLKDFKTEVERMTGLKMEVIYGRGGQLNAETSPGVNLFFPSLWVARYDTRLDPQVDEPWIEGGPQEYVEPRDWDDWLFWQYADGQSDAQEFGVGPLGSKSIDKNVANMTAEELYKLANLLPEPLPEPEPEPPKDVNAGIVPIVSGGKSDQVQLYTFFPPKAGERQTYWAEIFGVAFGKGEVDKINVHLVVGGVSFKWKSYSVRYRDFVFETPPMFYFREDDYILVEVIPVDGKSPHVEVKVGWN